MTKTEKPVPLKKQISLDEKLLALKAQQRKLLDQKRQQDVRFMAELGAVLSRHLLSLPPDVICEARAIYDKYQKNPPAAE